VPAASACRAAHSKLNPAAFAASVGLDPHAAYLAQCAALGCDMGYCGGAKLRYCDNHPSAYAHADIVDATVAEELRLGHILDVTELYEACADLSLLVSPLAVVFHPRTGKPRLVVDGSFGRGSAVNDFVDPTRLPHVRLQRPSDLADTIVGMQQERAHDPVLLQNYDLAHAYKSMPVRAEDWWQIGLAWRGRVYWWIVCPFGHRASGNALCAATSLVTAHMRREHGVRSHAYVDDLGTAMFASEAATVDGQVADTCTFFGFERSEEKLTKAGPPAAVKDWVGFTFDTELRQLRVPADKLQRISSSITAALAAGAMSPRAAHSLWSQLLHLGLAIPALAPFTATLRRWVNASGGTRCSRTQQLDADVSEDLAFWLSVVHRYNGVHLLPAAALPPTATVLTDASSFGYGGIVVETNRHIAGAWAPTPSSPAFAGGAADAHINFLEGAAALALVRDAARCGHRRIHVLSDNTSAVAAIHRMRSASPHLLPVQRALAHLTLTHCLHATASHVPGVQNLADGASRGDLSLFRQLFPGSAPISLENLWAQQLQRAPRSWATQSH
jgi:hypothetical protein